MLEELGVLAPRAEEKGRQIANLTNEISNLSRHPLELFLSALVRSGRTSCTILKYIYHFREFEKWMIVNVSKDSSLITASESSIGNYLASRSTRYSEDESDRLNKLVHESYSAIDRFFKFCILEKKVVCNPCDKIEVSRTQDRIHICTPDQLKKLQAYIKSSNANPEYAMLLALVLFYGLTTDDLKCAQLSEPFTAKQLKLVLRRRPRSHGKKYYHRAQTITCSNQPSWFLRLQNEFLKIWRIHYVKVKSTYPRFSLILPRNNVYNRPLATDTIRERMKEATTAAAGFSIPIRVLRQTCGHLHTKYRDASALSTLGWSPGFAYQFSWGPRTYFIPRSNRQP